MTINRPDDDRPSKRLVEQRIRNRIIEYLDLAGSFAEQQRYEVNVPIAYVPYEVINMWEDYVPSEPRAMLESSTVYSPDEIAAMLAFHAVWEKAAEALPFDYPRLEVVQALPAWNDLRRAAISASLVFGRRGRLPEDREVP